MQRTDGGYLHDSLTAGLCRKVCDFRLYFVDMAKSETEYLLLCMSRQPTGLLTGIQPVLAECYTPPFEVMSAKKFPGMLDPTPMSQAFAKQGLRIPTVSELLRMMPTSPIVRLIISRAEEGCEQKAAASRWPRKQRA